MEITKIDAQTIRFTPEPVVTQPEAITYTLDQLYEKREFLANQPAAIQAQKDADDAKRDAEIQDAQDRLAQVNALIDEAEKQGVKTGAEVVQEAQESAAARLAVEQAEVGELQDGKEPLIP
jgi:hypothetical protein